MTFWEFQACMQGWNKAQGGGHHYNGDPLTDAEYDALCELGDMWNGANT